MVKGLKESLDVGSTSLQSTVLCGDPKPKTNGHHLVVLHRFRFRIVYVRTSKIDRLRTSKINPDLAASCRASRGVNEMEMPVVRPASGYRGVGGVDSQRILIPSDSKFTPILPPETEARTQRRRRSVVKEHWTHTKSEQQIVSTILTSLTPT
jgi:hypothetical protein